MKDKIFKILKYVLIYIIMIVCFFIFLYTTALIPQSAIEENTKKSSNFLNSKGIREKIGLKPIILDNWSDAIMLNTSYSIDNEKTLESIMLNRRSYDSNRKLELIKENDDENPIYDLEQTILKNNTYYYAYARYWHGYLVFLRPMLVILNYIQIRIVFLIIIITMLMILIHYINKNVGKEIAIVFGLILMIFSYQYVGLSIQYCSVTILFIAFSTYIAKNKQAKNELFFIIGGLTSFFDLLTTPLLTLRNTFISFVNS